MLKKRVFIHQNIPYAFNWNITNHRAKLYQITTNKDDFIKLGTYLKRIYKGNIPNTVFNSSKFPRVSQFKIRGIKPAFISSFSKRLIREGIVERSDSKSKLPEFAQSVYENFKNHNINKDPGHEPILKNILIKDTDSIAIEVPIWKRFSENKFITGHIDLIQIENNTIKVIDYKPEGKFLLSLPQVATYGLLLKSMFNLDKLTCMSFNKKEMWEFEPNVLLKEVKEYLVTYNIKERVWENFFLKNSA
ncbi:MAG: hypothetical protein ACFE85_09560 [Candidatus Hodarchaeota archaeon]